MDRQTAVVLRHNVGDLPFKVELLLSAGGKRAFELVRRCGNGFLRITARHVHWRGNVLLEFVRFASVENGWQWIDFDDLLGHRRSTAGRFAGFGDDGIHRLAKVLHQVVGEYWVVFYDCADVVQAGHGFSAVAIDYARHGANDVE